MEPDRTMVLRTEEIQSVIGPDPQMFVIMVDDGPDIIIAERRRKGRRVFEQCELSGSNIEPIQSVIRADP